MSSIRRYLINLATALDGTPYVWGGNAPYSGLDCSGFVNFVYGVFGLLPEGDRTAEGIYDYFSQNRFLANFVHIGNSLDLSLTMIKPGDLVFYGKTRITHVAIYYGANKAGQHWVIAASGGDSKTTDFTKAAAKNAKVKASRLDSRKDLVAIIGVKIEEAIIP